MSCIYFRLYGFNLILNLCAYIVEYNQAIAWNFYSDLRRYLNNYYRKLVTVQIKFQNDSCNTRNIFIKDLFLSLVDSYQIFLRVSLYVAEI